VQNNVVTGSKRRKDTHSGTYVYDSDTGKVTFRTSGGGVEHGRIAWSSDTQFSYSIFDGTDESAISNVIHFK
jgi:hypothetical protein